MQQEQETAIHEVDHKVTEGQTPGRWDTLKKGVGRLGTLGSVLLATILLIIVFSILSPYF